MSETSTAISLSQYLQEHPTLEILVPFNFIMRENMVS